MEDTATAAVIVNYRTKELTADAIGSVLAEPEVGEVVVVDNASGDGSVEFLRAHFRDRRVRVVESDTNRGFGPGVNAGVALCEAPLLLVLNSDAALRPGSLGLLAKALLADPTVGVVAPAVLEPDGHLQAGAYGRLPKRRDIVLSNGWVSPRADRVRDGATPGWVSGVAMLLRRADFVAVGGFDERFSMYLEDVDLCRRLRDAGKSVHREPSAAVVHQGGRSWGSRGEQTGRFHESKLRYFENLGVSRLELGLIRLTGKLRTRLLRP